MIFHQLSSANSVSTCAILSLLENAVSACACNSGSKLGVAILLASSPKNVLPTVKRRTDNNNQIVI